MKLLSNLLVSFGLMLCISTAISGESIGASKLQMELWRTLFVDFARQHSLSDSEVMEVLGALIVTDENLKKVTGRMIFDGKYLHYMNVGGVMPLGRGIYYFADRARNTLSVSHNSEWEGLESSQPEAVFTDGEHVSHTLDGIDLSKAMIVIFSPSEVRFLDLMGHSGGLIPRKKASDGNDSKQMGAKP